MYQRAVRSACCNEESTLIVSPGIQITIETWDRLHAQRIEFERLQKENAELKRQLEAARDVKERLIEALIGR